MSIGGVIGGVWAVGRGGVVYGTSFRVAVLVTDINLCDVPGRWRAWNCWPAVAPPTGLEPPTCRLTAGRSTSTGASGAASTDLLVGIVVWSGSNGREFVDTFVYRLSTVDSHVDQAIAARLRRIVWIDT